MGTGRKERIVSRNPTKGAGATMRGILLQETDMPFFHQLLLKEPTGFNSLPFHPKQMINK